MITSDPRMDMERSVRSGEDYDLSGLIARARGDEDLIADLIELDGRHRVARGNSVSLERYLSAVPHIEASLQLIDAAIDVTLRAMAQSREGLARAASDLERAYPNFARQIRDAFAFADCTDSVVASPRRRRGALIELPCQLGPEISKGGLRFDLRSLIGSGSEGSVYLAVDRELSDTPYPAWVAVKVLGEGSTAEVLDEATKARRVDSVHVVRTLDRGIAPNGHAYVVHEYVNGGTLHDALATRPEWLTTRTMVGLLAKVARGLQAVHGAGLTHCDIKPANILLTENHEPKLSDFGIARRREPTPGRADSTKTYGSLACVAPETFRERWRASLPVSDLYGLGAVLVYAMTGRYVNGENREEVMGTLGTGHRPAYADDALAEIERTDSDLGAIAARAVALDPKLRYASAESFAMDLEAWLRHEPLHWTKPGRWKRVKLAARRDPAAAWALAIACLVLIAAAVVVTGQIAARKSDRLASQLKITRDREKAIEERLKDVQDLIIAMSNSVNSMPSGKLSTEWFPMLTMLESLAGPVITDGRGKVDFWSERIKVLETLLAKYDTKGTGDDFENCLWRATLGFWLINVGRPEQAEIELARAQRTLLKYADPSDKWIRYIDLLRAVAAVDHACAATPVDREALLAAVTTLATERELFDEYHTANSVHNAVIEALLKAAGPEGLNDGVMVKRWKDRVKEITRK